MSIPFRQYHITSLLSGFEAQTLPLDFFMARYFKEHPSLGSKDRAEISEMSYGLIRWRALVDYLTAAPLSWEKRFATFQTLNPSSYSNKIELPLHIRVSFPKFLFNLLCNNYGEQRAKELCLISNSSAPTTLRANEIKISRSELIKRLSDRLEITPCQLAPFGFTLKRRTNLFTLPEFKEGFFEVQDEGSQLVADLVDCLPGQLVLDYCAGSGGKSLAFAGKMQGKGQLFLHDIRPHALLQAKKRLKRAGIQNAQWAAADDRAKLKKLKKKMDWVLVDAPCSGSGTWRRNPDMKWRFKEETLPNLIGEQRQIFEKALSFLAPGGRIVYATCSLFPEENELQMEHFKKIYGLKVVNSPFQSFPTFGGMDGFFGVVLTQ